MSEARKGARGSSSSHVKTELSRARNRIKRNIPIKERSFLELSELYISPSRRNPVPFRDKRTAHRADNAESLISHAKWSQRKRKCRVDNFCSPESAFSYCAEVFVTETFIAGHHRTSQLFENFRPPSRCDDIRCWSGTRPTSTMLLI